jgi:ubiquinone biosynthesis protein COQ9
MSKEKNIKLSKEDLETLRGYQKKQSQITFNLGNVDIQKAILEGQRNQILENLANLQEQSNKTAKELQEKYGDGNIDLETGEFIVTE